MARCSRSKSPLWLDRLGLAVMPALLVAALGATPAAAGVGGAIVPTWPATMKVGQNVSTYIDIFNSSTGVNAGEKVTVLSISYVPSCQVVTQGVCATPDLNVFAIDTLAIADPNTSCKGINFNVVADPTSPGRYTIAPKNGVVHLGPNSATINPLDPPLCTIQLNAVVLRMPNDSTPPVPSDPITTQQLARATLKGQSTGTIGNAGGNTTITITPPDPIDLSISKSNGVTSVNGGAALIYTIVVANAGPSDADGAILRDPTATGLLKTGTPTCGSQVGGAVCPTATLTNANLESANGVAIPKLPAGSSLTFSVFVTVQATP